MIYVEKLAKLRLFVMHDLIQKLYLFLPNWLPETGDMKKDKKAEDRARDAYEKITYKNQSIYDIQLKCVSLIRQIEISKLLAMNEVILPIIVDEYVELNHLFTQLKKMFQSIKANVPNIALIDSFIKTSQLKQQLWEDLQLLKNKNIDFDVSTYMDIYATKIKSS